MRNQILLFTRVICFVLLSFGVHAQTNPSAQTLPVNFTSQSGNTLPPGFALHRFGTIPTSRILTPANVDLPYNATFNAGGWRDEAANGLSMLASGTNAAGALVIAINTTGQSNISIGWTVRTILQQASRDNSIALQYRIGNSGNFTDIGTTTTYSSAGKAVNDFASYTEQLPAAAENQTEVQLRWLYWESSVGLTGSRDRLAIDEISIAAPACSAPTNQPTSFSFTPSLDAISGSFNAAAIGTVNPDAYLVLISSSPTLGAAPESGTTYAIDDVIGNGRVISNNNSTNFNATGLTPASTYYFYAYSYNSAQNCYNLNNPLTAAAATSNPPACTPPATGASNLTTTAISGNSIDLAFTRGNGDNVLIVAHTNAPVDASPYNGIGYSAGNTIGNGNTVIYNGPAASFSYTGLSANTNYYFAVYEYTAATNCYITSPLTGNYTTTCTQPIDVTAATTAPANGAITLNWTNPSGICYDEILVVASNTTISGQGANYTSTANSNYTTPEQVVFRGLAANLTVTGLTNGTTYYFKIFTRNNGLYSGGIQITGTPFDPLTGFQYLYGNLHAHSHYSDGNKDDISKTPKDDYEFARDANCMDFLGISEHNHSGAGMSLPNYSLGYAQANAVNGVAGGSGNSIVTLWGMEWGVISGGGHMLVYGFDDKLIGWESGNYDIYCAKNDYNSMFGLINNQPNSFATLAHPNTGDYGSIASAYNTAADNAVVGAAIESGPAFSTNTTYNDFPSSLSYLSYYKTMLARGYRLGAQMDHDNHNMTFGRTSTNRMVIMASAKTREAIISAIKEMRFYASQDCNVRIDFKLNNQVMGSNVIEGGLPTITMNITDPDVENTSSIELWGGKAGSTVPAAPIKTYSNQSSFTFDAATAENQQATADTYYYYCIITQADGNKIVTSPIWYTRNDLRVLPVQLISFNGWHVAASKANTIHWKTSEEINSGMFELQRSADGRTFNSIASIAASGNSTNVRAYQYADMQPLIGINYYRLKTTDINGRFTYSSPIMIKVGQPAGAKYILQPNISSSYTIIKSSAETIEHLLIQLTNTNGQVIKSYKTLLNAQGGFRIELNGLTSGYYFVKIINTETGLAQTEKLFVL